MRRPSDTPGVLISWIFQLAWAVWFGGLLVLGAVSAPGIFQTARRWPAAASAPVAFRFAGIAARAGFDRFNHLSLACGVALLAAGAAAWMRDRRVPRLHVVRLTL